MENNLLENIIFRKLNENDKELFVNLRISFIMDCFNKNINEIDKKEIENSLNSYFIKHIRQNDFIGIVGEYNGNIVSVIYLIIEDYPANPNLINGKKGTILNVFTFPEYRKKRIAKKILSEIIKEAKLNGIKSIELKATNDGYELYKGVGFIDDNDYKNMILKL